MDYVCLLPCLHSKMHIAISQIRNILIVLVFMLCVDAVRANQLTRSATNADIDNVIMEWLRTACDRDGGRHSRGSTKERNCLNCSNTEDVNNSHI